MVKDKGYIDLSKRRVSPEDIERCMEVVSKAKAVNSILRHVASTLGYKTNEELEELYRKTAWHFEAKTKKKGSSYDWFKQVMWISLDSLYVNICVYIIYNDLVFRPFKTLLCLTNAVWTKTQNPFYSKISNRS